MRKFLITVNSQQFDVEVEEVRAGGNLKTPVVQSSVQEPLHSVSSHVKSASAPTNGASKVISPMPGNIFKVNVKPGDQVKKGQTIIVLEAMKMENEINASADGKVADVKVAVGQNVSMGQVLVEFA